ncbi:MAG: Na/Pi cotransporter family protein [Eubacteriales bacterium]|nr:Na/Pi cotransporter family protein [Eubacteriales bacterium]MDD3881586.1 Na/Pi cotransporter family protein [Eubacteriales bacterium]MDD4512355.1 Na/Pi cotransporter family protein [Eubacteriales bacterium]
MSFMNVLSLFGGLGLFLFGMKTLGEGLERAAGSKLRNLLTVLTKNRLLAMLVGILITAVMQSSSATTVMVVGFVNAGLMNLVQAIGVIMGANIGTTVTSLMLSVDIDFGAIFCCAGMLLLFIGKKEGLKQAGTVLMGAGILFVGMNLMSESMAPLREWDGFTNVLTGLKNPLIGVLVGAGITAVIQSSAASIGILQALSASGLIGLDCAVFVLFGQNIGTCVTALLAAVGANRTARRAAVVHLMFNVIGTLIFLLIAIFVPFADWIAALAPDQPKLQISLAHIVFNITTTALMLPLAGVLEKIACFIVPGSDPVVEGKRLKYVDERMLQSPPIAVAQIFKEVRRMGTIAQRNILAAMDCCLKCEAPPEKAKQIEDTEEVIDYLNHEITHYLVEVKALDISEKDQSTVGSFFHLINDFERIGDHAENLLEIAQSRIEKSIKFTDKANNELAEMWALITLQLDEALRIFREQISDPKVLAIVEEREQKIDDMTQKLRDNHIERLKSKKCTAKSGMLYFDLINNLERVADHCTNIATSVRDADISVKKRA